MSAIEAVRSYPDIGTPYYQNINTEVINSSRRVVEGWASVVNSPNPSHSRPTRQSHPVQQEKSSRHITLLIVWIIYNLLLVSRVCWNNRHHTTISTVIRDSFTTIIRNSWMISRPQDEWESNVKNWTRLRMRRCKKESGKKMPGRSCMCVCDPNRWAGE